jgi:cysteine synthase
MVINQTPMIRISNNLLVKLEHHNPTGSHKYRAAKYIVNKAILNGQLKPLGGKRIIEKSGGNFGLGLAFEAAKQGIGVDLVIGLSFSPIKRCLCEQFGARLVGLDLLKGGMKPKDVISTMLRENEEKYFFSDQFNNPENFIAHYEETGTEVVNQIQHESLSDKNIVLVKGAGTGASVTGIAKKLRETFSKVKVFLVHPSNCDLENKKFGDHIMEGTMVGVHPPFLNLNLVDDFISVTNEQAIEGQRMLANQIGVFPGVSSGANFYAAFMMSQKFKETIFITISYDLGEGYLLRQVMKNDPLILSGYIDSE